jgi:hypothetical protein
MQNKESKMFSLNSVDYKKILIGGGIAILGAIATYLQDTIPNVNFGDYSIIVYAVNAVLINTIRKFIS